MLAIGIGITLVVAGLGAIGLAAALLIASRRFRRDAAHATGTVTGHDVTFDEQTTLQERAKYQTLARGLARALPGRRSKQTPH